MAKSEKLKKKIKRLQQELSEQSTLPKETKKEIKRLEMKIAERDQQIADLRRKLSKVKNASSKSSADVFLDNAESRKLAVEQKNAWKRHSYLGECYDEYLESGYDKERARTKANQDLMDRFGKEVGFSAEQLNDILS